MSDKEKAKLAMDVNGTAVQGALCPRRNGSQNVSFGAASAVSTELVNAEIVRLCAKTADCRIRFGDFSGVAALATDMLLPYNIPEYFALRGNRWIAVIQDSAPGVLNIQIME